MKTIGIYRTVILIWITVISIAINSCKPSNSGTAEIGVLTPLSGENAKYGQATKRGIDLAIENIKQDSMLNNIKIELKYEDTKLEASLASSAFQKLVTVDKVIGIIGPFGSSEVNSIGPNANKNKTVILSASATDDKIANLGDYVFRNISTNMQQGIVMANFVVNDLRIKDKIIVFSLNNDYGASLSSSFKKRVAELGGKIIYEDKFDTGSKDFRTLIAKIKTLSPSFIFIPDHDEEAGIFLQQAKELGVTTPMGGGDGSYTPTLLQLAGKGAEGFYLTVPDIDRSNPETQEFIKQYKDKYHSDVDVYSAYAYDAYFVIADAIHIVQSQGKTLSNENLKDALYSVSYKGITGLNKFDKDGEVNKPFVVYVVRDGRFQPISK